MSYGWTKYWSETENRADKKTGTEAVGRRVESLERDELSNCMCPRRNKKMKRNGQVGRLPLLETSRRKIFGQLGGKIKKLRIIHGRTGKKCPVS